LPFCTVYPLKALQYIETLAFALVGFDGFVSSYILMTIHIKFCYKKIVIHNIVLIFNVQKMIDPIP